MAKTSERVKLWVVVTPKTAKSLARLAKKQNRSRASLLAVIVTDAATSPDAAQVLGK